VSAAARDQENCNGFTRLTLSLSLSLSLSGFPRPFQGLGIAARSRAGRAEKAEKGRSRLFQTGTLDHARGSLALSLSLSLSLAIDRLPVKNRSSFNLPGPSQRNNPSPSRVDFLLSYQGEGNARPIFKSALMRKGNKLERSMSCPPAVVRRSRLSPPPPALFPLGLGIHYPYPDHEI